ncbi:unnamed protein product [Triticum turgidum subsp. durum]|uniref:Uncharacterized protein n=1 Tax=Triticum turgidum subsp. durum TaxID=4567 RepID=A0A9R1AZI6_TRITD|nr:unnamed protein product [Triticum turgidum subsp. durum]
MVLTSVKASDDHGRVARRHEMWFSAPVGVVHERVGDDGINAVHSGSCHGALWWPLWYSSVAGQVSLVTRQVQSAEQTLFSKREEEGDLGSCPRAVSGDAPMRKESGAFRLDVPLEFDLVSFQIILCSAT